MAFRGSRLAIVAGRLGGLASVLALAVGFGAGGVLAQEIVTLAPRPGVTQSVFVTGMLGRRPSAVAVLFPGGGGYIRLRSEGGQTRFESGNFLVRARLEFIRNLIQPVIFDAPSDQQVGEGMSDAFRAGAAHVTDARAVVAEIKRRFPGLPIFLIGTSRGTMSATYLARALGREVQGVVLTASRFMMGVQRPRPFLALYDWSAIPIPVLFAHHRDDRCPETPYAEAARLADRFPLISVRGGKPPESGPCDAFSQHGFLGMEAKTVDAIAGWMLDRPYAKEVE